MDYAVASSIDMMEVIHLHGAPWTHAATKLAVSKGYLVLLTAFACDMKLWTGEKYISEIIKTHDQNVIDLMISRGYTPSSSLLIRLLAAKKLNLARHLIKHNYVQFSYHCFKYIDNVAILNIWLENGLDLQYHGRNIVKQAIRNGYYDIIIHLTENNYQYTQEDALSSLYGKSSLVFEHLFKLFDKENSPLIIPLNIMYEHYASRKKMYDDHRYKALVKRGSIDYSKVLSLSYFEIMTSPTSKEKCPICLEYVNEYVEFVCKHMMHISCFYAFLAKSSTYTCSVCRRAIFPDSLRIAK